MERILSFRPEHTKQDVRTASLKRLAPDEPDDLANSTKSITPTMPMALDDEDRKQKVTVESSNGKAATSNTMKRHRVREPSWGEITLCANCACVYGDQSNQLHQCMYHPGELQVDDDVSRDICVSSSKKSADYAKSFWTCCRGGLNSTGCLITRHLSIATAPKSAFCLFREKTTISKGRLPLKEN